VVDAGYVIADGAGGGMEDLRKKGGGNPILLALQDFKDRFFIEFTGSNFWCHHLSSIALGLAAQEENIPPEICPLQGTFPMSGKSSILVLWALKVIWRKSKQVAAISRMAFKIFVERRSI